MAVSGIGGGSNYAPPTSGNKQNLPGATKQSSDEVTAEFMQYMAKTPAERMQEAWLAQHGISKKDFDAMPDDKKKALMEQMRQEIEMKAKMQAEKGNDKVNLIV